MITLPETFSASRFPVWQTAMDAMDYCWQRRRLAARFGYIPLLVGIIASWALLWFEVSTDEPSAELFAIAILQVLIFLAPTVTWYRIVTYGEQEALARPVFTLGRLEIRLLLWQILLLLGLIVPFAIAAGLIGGLLAAVKTHFGEVAAIIVAVPFVIAGIVAFAVTGTRLAMMLALASLDAPAGFKAAWRLTRGIAWRLTGTLAIIILAVVLFIALAELAAWLIGMIFAIATDASSSVVLAYARVPAQAVINLAGLYASATLFGLVYKARAETNPAPMEASAPV